MLVLMTHDEIRNAPAFAALSPVVWALESGTDGWAGSVTQARRDALAQALHV